MPLIIIGALLSILIPVFIYKKILKGHGTVKRKTYIVLFILAATLYTLPIIILEQVWDAIFKNVAMSAAVKKIVVSFLRAALLEEAVKYLFTYRVVKKHASVGLKEVILLAGIVGIGYGFTEKLAYANGAAIILNALVPGHMVFQWFMGYYIYKGLQADGKERGKCFRRAFFIPFLIHGVWDAALGLLELMEWNFVAEAISLLLTFVLIAVMIVVTVKTAVWIHRIPDEVQ